MIPHGILASRWTVLICSRIEFTHLYGGGLASQEERRHALEELRAKVRIARDEGISFAAIARAAGVSREYVRRLYAGR
jgi:hypothetical protein